MAVKNFTPRAAARSQVDVITVAGSVAAGNTYTVTINTRSETYTAAAGDSTTTVAAGLATSLGASQSGEFQEIDWVASGNTIRATSGVPGRPFTLSVSSSGGTISSVTVTTTSSPSDLSVAGNWSGATLPAAGDDWVFELTAVPVLYGLAGAPVSVTVRESFTGGIGLPVTSDAGYYEYRPTALSLTADCTLNLEVAGNATAAAYQFSWNSKVVTATVSSPSPVGAAGQEQVWLSGLASGSVVNVYGGSVLVAPLAGSTAVLNTVRVINGVFRGTGGQTFAAGATIDQTGGQVDVSNSVTTWSMNGNDAVGAIRGSAAVTTLNLDAGTLFHASTGTIANLNVGSGATIDFSAIRNPVTITNCTIAAGAAILDPDRRVTFTNGIKLNRCNLSEVRLELGTHLTVTPGNY